MVDSLKLSWKRRIAQLGFLAVLGEFSFYGIFRCPFAVPYVSCGNCPVIQCPGRDYWIPIWIGLLVSAIAFGRAFCGWACPGGLVQDILSKFSLLRGKVQGELAKVLSFGKYPMIVASLVFLFLLGNPRWAIPIRTGDFFNSVSLTFAHADPIWLWRTVLVLAAVGLAGIVPHFWCRFLCPTGGALEIFNRLSVVKYFKTDECNECDSCRRVCTLETRPAESNCTNCGDCGTVCPVDAIKVGTGLRKEQPKKAALS